MRQLRLNRRVGIDRRKNDRRGVEERKVDAVNQLKRAKRSLDGMLRFEDHCLQIDQIIEALEDSTSSIELRTLERRKTA
jgi:hypothetical protein